MAILDKIERFVDKAIPYLILVLFGIVIIDVFYVDVATRYHTPLLVLDAAIISFFAVDLIFKYNRVRNISRFLKLYWLDVLAVFPFFILLRVIEEVILISEGSVATLRSLFHVGLILEEEVAGGEAAKIVKTAEILSKEGRLALLSDFVKPLRRIPRLFKAVSFYEHPDQKKTLYHKKIQLK